VKPVRLGFHGSPLAATRIVRRAGHGDDTVYLGQCDIADPFRTLRDGEHDLIITKFVLREPDLDRSATLTTEPRAVVVAATHPLARRETVSIEDLTGYEVFDRPGEHPAYVWDEMVPRTTPSGQRIHRGHKVSTIAEMMRLVAEASAVHISLASAAHMAPPTIRVVPIHDLPPAPVMLAWRRGRLTDAARAFIADVEEGHQTIRAGGPVSPSVG
jgi:DNA-binding transcriptional LysR family regulator